ncbi:MAG: hypothetical protein K6E51_10285 [Treponema sp.]|nr:hypothetical protein [Treponema sp.]
MLKKILGVVLCTSSLAGLFAYNPPAGGENIFGISSPFQLTSAQSAAGGAFLDVTPASQVYNPALGAFEQRLMLDLGFTYLRDGDSLTDHDNGFAGQFGLLFPTRWGVASGEFFVVNEQLSHMDLEKLYMTEISFAKEVTDSLSVGAGLAGGLLKGYENDWAAGLNVGAFYNYGDLGPLSDVRFGVSFLNLGKMFTKKAAVIGIDEKTESDTFPGVATLRAGIAATFLTAGDFEGAASLDVAVPYVQNLVIDTGVQFMYKDFVKLSTAWECNLREVAEDSSNWLPAVGLAFRFKFQAKNNGFMKKMNWDEGEMTVAGAWQRMYEHVDAYSAGVVVKLGLEDTEPPVIQLFNEKETSQEATK